MRIKLLTPIAGDHFSYPEGYELNWPADDAKRMIARGVAVSLDPDKDEETSESGPETTSTTPTENAMKRRGRPRKMLETAAVGAGA